MSRLDQYFCQNLSAEVHRNSKEPTVFATMRKPGSIQAHRQHFHDLLFYTYLFILNLFLQEWINIWSNMIKWCKTMVYSNLFGWFWQVRFEYTVHNLKLSHWTSWLNGVRSGCISADHLSPAYVQKRVENGFLRQNVGPQWLSARKQRWKADGIPPQSRFNQILEKHVGDVVICQISVWVCDWAPGVHVEL